MPFTRKNSKHKRKFIGLYANPKHALESLHLERVFVSNWSVSVTSIE